MHVIQPSVAFSAVCALMLICALGPQSAVAVPAPAPEPQGLSSFVLTLLTGNDEPKEKTLQLDSHGDRTTSGICSIGLRRFCSASWHGASTRRSGCGGRLASTCSKFFLGQVNLARLCKEQFRRAIPYVLDGVVVA